MTKNFSGTCSYTNAPETINITYDEVKKNGTLRSNYKKGVFDCSVSQECPLNGSPDCPIYLLAPASLMK